MGEPCGIPPMPTLTWMERGLDGRGTEGTIEGNKLTGNDGKVYTITLRGGRSFSFDRDGKTYHAERVNDKLVWSDGDEWIRRPGGLELLDMRRYMCCSSP